MSFSDDDRRAVYDVIGKRRDIRHFRAGAPLADDVLRRILAAAHQAPSVGYSQPWDFVVVRDRARRERIRESFLRVRAAEAARFPAGERREQYLAYQLEGILDSALNLCVTVDLRPADEAVLGTTAQPESLRWSACCAVQNLWLAARAEGVGVGWVSIVEPTVLRARARRCRRASSRSPTCASASRSSSAIGRCSRRPAGARRRPVADAIHDEQFAPRRRRPRSRAAAAVTTEATHSAVRSRERSGARWQQWLDALQAARRARAPRAAGRLVRRRARRSFPSRRRRRSSSTCSPAITASSRRASAPGPRR